MKKVIFIFHLWMIAANICIAQSYDTTYYENKSVLFISTPTIHGDSVISFYDTKGKSILSSSYIKHSFFDKKFGKNRTIIVINKYLYEDYCVSENDTVYNYFEFDDNFDRQLQSLYNYLEQHVVYPRNAMKKKIQALVKIGFMVETNGRMYSITPLTKHYWGFEEAVIKVLEEKKQFGFVTYKNQSVKLYLEIPFYFRIKERTLTD